MKGHENDSRRRDLREQVRAQRRLQGINQEQSLRSQETMPDVAPPESHSLYAPAESDMHSTMELDESLFESLFANDWDDFALTRLEPRYDMTDSSSGYARD